MTPQLGRNRVRVALTLALIVVCGAAVSGCAQSNKPGSSTPTSQSLPRPTTTASTPQATPTPSGSPAVSSSGGLCSASQLSGSVAAGAGGAAGAVGVTLVLTNTGTQPCTLQGWPGVSFVGNGNGTQLGNAAQFDRSTPHPTITLTPGAHAQAPLLITNAGNYSSSDCSPQTADGFRVYPPGSTTALFVKVAGLTACASTGVNLLSVGALVGS